MDQPSASLPGQLGWSPFFPRVDVENYGEVVASHPILVVHLWAPWNQYDRIFDVRLRAVAPGFADRIAFCSLDLDEIPDQVFWRNFGLAANVPALICYLHGQWVEAVVGMLTTREMSVRFEGWLEGLAGRPILYGSYGLEASCSDGSAPNFPNA